MNKETRRRKTKEYECRYKEYVYLVLEQTLHDIRKSYKNQNMTLCLCVLYVLYVYMLIVSYLGFLIKLNSDKREIKESSIVEHIFNTTITEELPVSLDVWD